MAKTGIATVSAYFSRDMQQCLSDIESYINQAREHNCQLLVLPEAALGGYLTTLGNATYSPDAHQQSLGDLPPALSLAGPEVKKIQSLAGDMVVVFGLCEASGDQRYNTAVAVHGDGILGSYRKVHQPLGENLSYESGDAYRAFDTPIGRLGMQICYDKAFPEAARILALDGAEIITSLSAWPMSRTHSAENIEDDRWKQRFDIYDRARATENQVFWVASNQAGSFGSLRFVCSAKIVDPGGAVLADTGVNSGFVSVHVDIAHEIDAIRSGGMYNLRDRRPELYGDITAENRISDTHITAQMRPQGCSKYRWADQGSH